jgi:hypothetical protein
MLLAVGKRAAIRQVLRLEAARRTAIANVKR